MGLKYEQHYITKIIPPLLYENIDIILLNNPLFFSFRRTRVKKY